MRLRTAVIDVCLATALAAATLIVVPGLGIVGVAAVVVVAVCLLSFGIERIARRRRRRSARARRNEPGRPRATQRGSR
jgi:uncharacterized membrane protein